jgi:predicted nucleic acid-binding protein
MIFVDTNYINRFLLKDIPEQFEIVNKLFLDALNQKVDLYSSDLIFFEVCWSLKQFHKLDEADILDKMYEIIHSGLIKFQSSQTLLEAILESKNNNLGIEDNFILKYTKKNKMELVTFDKKLSKAWKELK